jgi:hypothetical protein
MKLLFGIFSFVLISGALLNAQQKDDSFDKRGFRNRKLPEELRKYFYHGHDSLKIFPKFFNDSLFADEKIDYKIMKYIPDPDIDYKIMVYKPDPGIDYKIMKKKF